MHGGVRVNIASNFQEGARANSQTSDFLSENPPFVPSSLCIIISVVSF